MPVSVVRDGGISPPAIGVEEAAGFNAVLHERRETGGGSVGDVPQPDAPGSPAILLRCDRDQSLAFGSAPVTAGLQAAQIALIHLDGAAKPVPTRPDHGPPQLMQTRPGRLVASPTQHLLQPQCADSVLLAGDPPHGPKPDR